MMIARLGFVLVAVLATAGLANAKSLGNSDGPAENPPASFAGTQYVDSLGCVYIRAGYGGVITWVPRVSRSRELLCGYTPTVANAAPVRAVAAPPNPVQRRAAARVQPATTIITAPAVSGVVPPGFRSAWNDDRLNVNRGPRNETGDAQMATIWTDTVPRRLIADEGKRRARVATVNTGGGSATGGSGGADLKSIVDRIFPTARISTKSPNAVLPRGRYIQLGTFGVAANAQKTLFWLQSNEMPFGVINSRIGSKEVQIVVAGPFSDLGAIRRVLGQVVAAGYTDAFVRR